MVDLFGAPIEDEVDNKDDVPVDTETFAQDQTAVAEELTPQSNPNLTGHAAIEKRLQQLANTDKLPHALLITGPKGIGKATLSYRLARYLLADKDHKEGGTLYIAPEKPIFRKISSV